MDATDYWPFAWEYSIWNAAVTAVQFWMDDLHPPTLSNTIERIYGASFAVILPSTCDMWKKKYLFHCFVTTLNDTFE